MSSEPTELPPIQVTFVDQIRDVSTGAVLAEVTQGGIPAVQVEKWSTRLEGGCPACAAKHLSQAIVLADRDMISGHPNDPFVWLSRALILDQESRFGYPGHRFLAIGCLANAEKWSRSHLARLIRDARVAYNKGGSLPHLLLQVKPDGGQPHEDSVMVWAHIEEAIAELPPGDENRTDLRNHYDLPWPRINEKFVPTVTGILKNVVETYELGATNG